MKKKIIVYSILLTILLFIILIIGNFFYNFNAFAADSIKIPQTEKYDIEIYKIEKYKVWEMKNVYLYNGDYVFDKRENGKIIDNRFFMVNKKIQNINNFFNQFMKLFNKIQTENNETLIKFFDNFGLDDDDISKFGNKLNGDGFKAWYFIQHYNNFTTIERFGKKCYRPFNTQATIKEEFRFKYE